MDELMSGDYVAGNRVNGVGDLDLQGRYHDLSFRVPPDGALLTLRVPERAIASLLEDLSRTR